MICRNSIFEIQRWKDILVDTLPRPLVGQRLGELRDGALAGRIVHVPPRAAQPAGHGREIHDHAAAAAAREGAAAP